MHIRSRSKRVTVLFLVASSGALISLLSGCNRQHYRQAADREVDAIICQKTNATPWELPPGYSPQADPRSRLFDPSDPDDPALPWLGPNLYTYTVPELPSYLQASLPQSQTPSSPLQNPTATNANQIQLASFSDDSTLQPLRANSEDAPTKPPGLVPNQVIQQSRPSAESALGIANSSLILPIPERYWRDVAPEYLAQMFEFASVRDEYRRTFKAEPDETQRDRSRKLTFEEIVKLARLNSRAYQTQAENLYLAALDLTLEQYAYDTKFSAVGNGTALDYKHARTGGVPTETLDIPSRVQVNKLLATGGTVLGGFANSVVLTFEGPQGFASHVNSELFFDLSQSLFQRDMFLNPLIQSERNVVYAARDFVRFRRTFFFELLSNYYSLLTKYREIELESDYYFSLARQFTQAEVDVRSGLLQSPSRTQIDQIEQDMLKGRERLIGLCIQLDREIDELKLVMGLPTENPIQLDLTELESLTRQDRIQVKGEEVRRAQRRLQSERAEEHPVPRDLIGAAIIVVDRLVEWLELDATQMLSSPELSRLREIRVRLQVDVARFEAVRVLKTLKDARDAVPPAPSSQLLLQYLDALDPLLELVRRQLELAERLQAGNKQASEIARQLHELITQKQKLHDNLDKVLGDPQPQQLANLRLDAEKLLAEVQRVVRLGDQLTGAPVERPQPDEELKRIIEQTGHLLSASETLFESVPMGLPPIGISIDEAMGTALVQRLDLMNERGFVADKWRVIKLRADDLKSRFNLDANQTIGTHDDHPFGFTRNSSRTEVKLSLDLPLNRQAQRNAYRGSLIEFQRAGRHLMELEDLTKFDVREELRDLRRSRDEYTINVTSAALAASRVTGTRQELALGVPGVQVRDYLEALRDLLSASKQIAAERFDYLRGRAGLFVALEQTELDEFGFWPEIYNYQYQPTPQLDYPISAGPAYGEIPDFLKVSREIRRMSCVPPPGMPRSEAPRQHAEEELQVPPDPAPPAQ